MAPAHRPPHGSGRAKGKTSTEQAEEAADVQLRLKREAAERRHAAAAKQRAPGARSAGALPAHGPAAGRRRTP